MRVAVPPVWAGPAATVALATINPSVRSRINVYASQRSTSCVSAAGAPIVAPAAADAESQPLDPSEFAEIAVERPERQMARFPSHLQNQAVGET